MGLPDVRLINVTFGFAIQNTQTGIINLAGNSTANVT
jgi:hypothetical protein